jgi:hypothetical protein
MSNTPMIDQIGMETPQEQLRLVNRALESCALNPYRRKRLVEVSQSIQAEIILEQMERERTA